LFDDNINIKNQCATICIFDNKGSFIHEEKLQLMRNKRTTIDLTQLTSLAKSDYGTFSIFHSHTPKEVTELGSFLTERGYVSYCYKGAPLRSYVHGNLDAIAQYPDGKMQLLGARSFYHENTVYNIR